MIDAPLHVCLAGLDVVIFGAERTRVPVIFVEHGRGGCKEHCFDYCRELQMDGCIAITIDQRNHGARTVDPACNGGWSSSHATDMYGCLVGLAMDISLLIDLLPARLGIDVGRVGMTGVSMGGHATLLAMAYDSRIAVGAPLIGGGDYRHLMELRAQTNSVPFDDFSNYYPPGLDAMVRRYDPIHHAARFADRPLLLLNGEDDTLVQIDCNRRFYTAALPHYTDPTRLCLSAYPGIGHEAPPAMWQEARAWLNRWL